MESRGGFPAFITAEYAICGILGEGAFGVVHLVKDRYSGMSYALKTLDKNESGQDMSYEGKLMMKLNHPHITRLHEYMETRRKYYIIMDYMKGGSLRQRLAEHGNFSESLSNLYFYQMCVAVQYLHANNITHRDLKPDNMLLASDHEKTLLKISDFGASNNNTNYMYSFAGTKIYVAPEIMRGIKYGKQVDIWSLGVVLYECLSGNFPFHTETAILQGNYNFNNYKWRSVSNLVTSLLKSILKVDPARRCNITYILKSQWLYEYNAENTVEYLKQRYAY